MWNLFKIRPPWRCGLCGGTKAYILEGPYYAVNDLVVTKDGRGKCEWNKEGMDLWPVNGNTERSIQCAKAGCGWTQTDVKVDAKDYIIEYNASDRKPVPNDPNDPNDIPF